jgi:hypothetical protein
MYLFQVHDYFHQRRNSTNLQVTCEHCDFAHEMCKNSVDSVVKMMKRSYFRKVPKLSGQKKSHQKGHTQAKNVKLVTSPLFGGPSGQGQLFTSRQYLAFWKKGDWVKLAAQWHFFTSLELAPITVPARYIQLQNPPISTRFGQCLKFWGLKIKRKGLKTHQAGAHQLSK